MLQHHATRAFTLAYKVGEHLREHLWPPQCAVSEAEVEQLRREVRVVDVSSPSPCADASLHFWQTNERALKERILSEDPSNFLRWPLILNTMFVERSPYVTREFRYLVKHPQWFSRWRSALQESPVGRPHSFAFYPQTSANLVHQAYHVMQFEENTGRHVNDFDLVVEFGGGYGSLCRLVYNLGYGGQYILFDLPICAALQRFFLRNASVDCAHLDEGDALTQAGTLSRVAELANLMAGKKVLFIATWSLTEAPASVRDRFEPIMQSCSAVLLGYAGSFYDIDNRGRLLQWRARQGNSFVWHDVPIAHLPNNYYLFGCHQPWSPEAAGRAQLTQAL